MVLINLGTNDYSTTVTPSVEQYVGTYVRLIELVRKQYGPVPVICIRPHSAGAYLSASFKVLQQRLSAHKDVHFAEFMPGIITVEKDLGASYHQLFGTAKALHDARAFGIGGDGMGNKREMSSKGRKE